VIYDSAKISITGDTLFSNYTDTRWYFNGQKLADNTSQLKATLPGIYTIEVDTLGCVSRDSVEYFITKSEEVLEATAFYPNPVETYLFIHHPNTIKHVAIFSSLGILILQQDSEQLKNSSVPGIDVSQLADGIYEAIITDGIGEMVVRFVKR
jgi:hypothetical protein